MATLIRRQIYLDHRCGQIDVPKIMTDDQLAEVLEGFVAKVRKGEAEAPPTQPPVPPSGNLPKVKKMAKRSRR